VEAAVEELRRESGGLPLKPAEDKKAAKDKKPEGAAA
jgi:hypothetical protein